MAGPKQDIYTIHITLKEATEDGEEKMQQLDERQGYSSYNHEHTRAMGAWTGHVQELACR